MKTTRSKADRVLFVLFIFSILSEIFLVWSLGSGWLYRWRTAHLPYAQSLELELRLSWLCVFLPGFSVFCLQFLLCRLFRRKPLALLPPGLLAAAAGYCGAGYFQAKGWDSWGWGILFSFCLVLILGCALGWAAYGIARLIKWCS